MTKLAVILALALMARTGAAFWCLGWDLQLGSGRRCGSLIATCYGLALALWGTAAAIVWRMME